MQSVLHNIIGPQEVHPSNLNGRTAIVTGGALGIGYEISRALALAGCKVIMVNRKEEQGSDAIQKIKSEKSDADIDWRECDLGNLGQVREVFSKLGKELEKLDFLALSAGINTNTFGLDHDGVDRHFGVNYLGQYYATNLLWPLIVKTSKIPGGTAPRVVALSSEMHRTANSDVKFESLEEINKDVGHTHLYGRTKLALILWIKYGLFERVIKKKGLRIYATSVHPGAVNTAMQDQWKVAYPGITGTLISSAMKFGGRDIEQGSYGALWCLTGPEIEEKKLNGYYFVDPNKEGKESSQASDPQLGENLWKLSEKIIKEKLGEDAYVDWEA